MNDKDIQNKALAGRKIENNKAFQHMEVGLVLTAHEKYKGVQLMDANLEFVTEKEPRHLSRRTILVVRMTSRCQRRHNHDSISLD